MYGGSIWKLIWIFSISFSTGCLYSKSLCSNWTQILSWFQTIMMSNVLKKCWQHAVLKRVSPDFCHMSYFGTICQQTTAHYEVHQMRDPISKCYKEVWASVQVAGKKGKHFFNSLRLLKSKWIKRYFYVTVLLMLEQNTRKKEKLDWNFIRIIYLWNSQNQTLIVLPTLLPNIYSWLKILHMPIFWVNDLQHMNLELQSHLHNFNLLCPYRIN